VAVYSEQTPPIVVLYRTPDKASGSTRRTFVLQNHAGTAVTPLFLAGGGVGPVPTKTMHMARPGSVYDVYAMAVAHSKMAEDLCAQEGGAPPAPQAARNIASLLADMRALNKSLE
jgi:hypothetical protein